MNKEAVEKAAKESAFRRHNFALGQVFQYLMSEFEEAKDRIFDANREMDEVPDEMKRQLMNELAAKGIIAFAVSDSLRLYKEAFGEYPLWTRFIFRRRHDPATPEQVDGIIEQMNDLFEDVEKSFGRVFKLYDGSKNNARLREVIYSQEATAGCEKVDLSGVNL